MDDKLDSKVDAKLKESGSPEQESVLEPKLYSGPLFFTVSPLKFIVMSMCTFGLYELFWQYKNWQLISDRHGSKLHSFWRTFFAVVFVYNLLSEIRSVAGNRGFDTKLQAGMLAAAWIVMTLTWRAPEPIFYISYFSWITLLPAVQLANKVALTAKPEQKENSKFSILNWVAILIGGGLIFLAIIGSLM